MPEGINRRPKLLFVSPRFLFPLDQGGKIRTANILRELKEGAFSITLTSPAPADDGRFAADIAKLCDVFASWPESRPSSLRRMVALADRLPVGVVADRSRAGRRIVARELALSPDLVVADFPHAGVLLPARINATSVMFTHNVEAEIFERHSARASGLRRLIWALQSHKMRVFEGAMLRRFDSVIAVSGRDAEALERRYQLPVTAHINTGVDLDLFRYQPFELAPNPEARGGSLIFVATMSWPANVEGVHFLLDEVWPLLLKVRPNIHGVIVGRDPPRSLVAKVRERDLNVTLTGFVDDIRPYVAQANVYVIPLWVGSGTRIKAFEAMALGRPVVSTSLGIEGLAVDDGTHFLRADTAQDFANAVLALLDDPQLSTRIALAARALMETHFTWAAVARQFEAICLEALARRRGDPDGADRRRTGASYR